MDASSIPHTLHIATFNIHKGFSHFNRRMTMHELRDRLHALGADIVFLQEVVGLHERHAARHADWPAGPQHEFLAGRLWTEFAYGQNAIYDEGHHGNAILSRYPIAQWENEDISSNPFERRGLLHCELEVPGWEQRLHCVCLHLGLFARGRRKQLDAVCDRIHRLVPDDAPLVIAGDFNDWLDRAGKILFERLNLREVFETAHGRTVRSFPAALPLFKLDRIYVRGFEVKNAHVLRGQMWSRLSDHAALTASLARI